MPEKEKFADIKNYEGLYQISTTGKVKSLGVTLIDSIGRNMFYPEKFLIPQEYEGYQKVLLYKEKKRREFKIHRLVAKAFIPNPENKLEVNHKNGIKSDNRVENLEWCTHSENMSHARENKLIKNYTKGEDVHTAKLKKKDILDIIKMNKNKELTQKEIASLYNVNRHTIYLIVHRKTWKSVKV